MGYNRDKTNHTGDIDWIWDLWDILTTGLLKQLQFKYNMYDLISCDMVVSHSWECMSNQLMG